MNKTGASIMSALTVLAIFAGVGIGIYAKDSRINAQSPWYEKYDLRCIDYYVSRGTDLDSARGICQAWKEKNDKDLDKCMKSIGQKHKEENGFPRNFNIKKHCKEKIRKQRGWRE